MTNHPKLQIYQGIIQYLLDSTSYDIENIAALSNASIKSIRTIYQGQEIPANFISSEKKLLLLYQMILELNQKTGKNLEYLVNGIKSGKIRCS
ncbi:TPA: hypothetical protein RG395_000974 [Legionella pneumophila]|nr:hypothetical protein [Legionella pneumophila]HAT5916153.1 hypothetical protein [Legionella pneumophila]HAT7773747.1 hypothetical protein [Legionella pneumophila]HAT7825322.1 hypothetical protein [Legionella pneumophila]HAT7918659.1 hypothetical protein [Legionella pneumophila]